MTDRSAGIRIIELESRVAHLQDALQSVVDASDRFVQDTGLKHGDAITDAVDAARKLLPKPHIRAAVDFITKSDFGRFE